MEHIDVIREKVTKVIQIEMPLPSVTAVANSSVPVVDVHIFQKNGIDDHIPMASWSIPSKNLRRTTKNLFLRDIPVENRDDLETFYICVFIDDKIEGINFVDGADAIRFAAGLPLANMR